jgi:PAS domain S-box-containing protein
VVRLVTEQASRPRGDFVTSGDGYLLESVQPPRYSFNFDKALTRETKIEDLLEMVGRLSAQQPGARCAPGEGPLAPLAVALNQLAAQLENSYTPENELFGTRSLVEQSPSIMLTCDASGKIRFINQISPGITPESVVGQSVYDFIFPDDMERVRGFIQRVLEHGEIVSYESRTSYPIGPEWYGARVGPIRLGEQIVGLTMITTDITDLKRAQLRLEQSNRELESFAYVASHDLQEPLRKIQTFAERLKATCAAALGPTGLDYLERMHGAATRMRGLIDDLLSFSRVSSKAQPFARVDLTGIVHEVLGDLESTIEKAGATVSVGPLPTLEADPTQMRQLFQNLLSNALKFRREDVAPSISVRGTTDVQGFRCVLEVEDNGIGFDEKYLERIFNVFQRLHGRGQYEGTGIGLAICRKIVERHGGEISARSSPGNGATFLITFPLQQPKPLPGR